MKLNLLDATIQAPPWKTALPESVDDFLLTFEIVLSFGIHLTFGFWHLKLPFHHRVLTFELASPHEDMP
jgi:hypothetical protein